MMNCAKCILVTGGAGYIGTHTVVGLVEAGFVPVIVDNFSNSSKKAIRAAEKLARQSITSYEVDLTKEEQLDKVFQQHEFAAVIHFAGFKAVGESMEIPQTYYRNNITVTLNLIECLQRYSVKNVVFSSSCTVYGNSVYLPIDEKHPVGNCTNPYGRTKYFIEQIFTDICKSDQAFNVILLRYFNPVGAHPSGLMGEDPNGIPNQIMPYIAQVAVGRRDFVHVFGDDYDTPDGTGIRDYIHVVDLARGHILAMKKLWEKCGLKIYNLGSGCGYSVLEIIKAFEKSAKKKIAFQITSRRLGDAEKVYADASLAKEELGWECQIGLQEMCDDTWRWQSSNPLGYEGQQ